MPEGDGSNACHLRLSSVKVAGCQKSMRLNPTTFFKLDVNWMKNVFSQC